MKILHTADWHLNLKLGKVDRTESLRRRVEEVAAVCKREAVDVLVVAGDLFSERPEVTSRVNEVADSLRHLRAAFARFFADGGIVLAVTGNHDQDGRVRPHLEVARAGLDVTAPPLARGGYFQPGKLYLLDTAFVGRVRDRRDGFDVQFALLPFPGLSRVLTGAETKTTAAELNRPVAEAVAGWIRDLPQQPGYDAGLRTVLVAHLNVTGADVGRGLFHRAGGDTEVTLDDGALPTGFDYIALGHVHKPQCLRGLSHVRYSGSLDRMDFGERDEEKGVVLVEIGPGGRVREPEFVPITPTAFVEATITSAETAAAELAAQVTDPSAVVKVVVEPAAAAAGAAVDLTIRDALPNVSRVEWPTAASAAGASPVAAMSGSVRERVIAHLESKPNDAAAPKDELLRLARTFLDQLGHT